LLGVIVASGKSEILLKNRTKGNVWRIKANFTAFIVDNRKYLTLKIHHTPSNAGEKRGR
jgi:hypothetical protein